MPSQNVDQVLIEEFRASQHDLSSVATMLKEMYEEFQAVGSFARLANDGAQIWSRGIAPLLGKNACLLVATLGGEAIGFAHGIVRLPPAYLQAIKTGFISHVFVSSRFRGRKIGHQLVDRLENWFSEREVQLLELNVVRGNASAKAFWESRGFELDLWQLRKGIR